MDALRQTRRWPWQPFTVPLTTNCGDKPKLLAIGIAPLGIISIGIVPMGVVSIGVVPMGVLSLGAVGMGVINICVVGMGIVVAGVNVMGIWNAGASTPHQHHPFITAFRHLCVVSRALDRARYGARAAGPPARRSAPARTARTGHRAVRNRPFGVSDVDALTASSQPSQVTN